MTDSARQPAAVLAELAALRAADLPVYGGRTLAYVYDPGLGPETVRLAEDAYAAMAGVNGLDMTAFPSVVALENEVVGTAARLLGGGPDTVGTVTSGGTESCLMAVLTAREHARATRGVTAPQLVLPVTAHAAFHKAAHLFGLEVVAVPVDGETFTPDPRAMAAAITDRTALVVVSAPSYAHGVVDPVAEVAAAAAERGVLCHVDACIGGWLLPYLRRLPEVGAELPAFDLAVAGVTSLSVDLHKYAYTPKGVSVVLFRDHEMRRHGYFACASWPGYPVVNATLQGTKSAGPLAAAWAVLRGIGDEGYLDLARRALRTARELRSGLPKITGLSVLGDPPGSLLAVASTDPDLDVFVVADCLRAHGWYVQPQPGFGGLPRTIHLTVTAAADGKASDLLAALTDAADEARRLGPATVDPALAEAAALIDPTTLTPTDVASLLDLAGLTPDGALPDRMAPVLALMETMPPPLAERLLPDVIGRLFHLRG
ncbi:pyridoxal phosphate-dependent decarboxylase family protein [Yinghuangia seranimata]|uniref:pyridoxal phosphate-dependent decarboxylase family protein n=1 Tax=Yinghuangia seranimata TaxID=408067 RepID=UPI00248CA478|nr:aminotransferase class V-fold PLP-dependent enzyme [Yinghuangia seranimata]MDI2132074.1 aminotransferase class V-fold PLP-dependent enzyme [Yinghuangia seranimata]